MDDTARGWGKTFGGVIGASFGPEGALVGMAIGSLLEAVLPVPKDSLGNILGNRGADGVKQSWRRAMARLSPPDQARMRSDLQQAFRDVVPETLYDIGGLA